MKQLHKHLYVAGQLQKSDFATLAEQGIKVIINNRPDNEEAGQLSETEARQLAEEHGISYYYLPMVNGQPLPEDTIPRFKEIIDNSEHPVLAHCRSGMRSSFIWALGKIAAGEISVDDAISAAQSAGIPLHNARPALENAAPKN